MREILFKGKRLNNGEWVEGFLFDDGLVDSKRWFIGSIEVIDAKYDVDNCLDIYGHCIYEVDPETVCQYTGLKDMNGKKIFEGDILKHESIFAFLSERKATCYKVIFKNGAFQYAGITQDYSFAFDDSEFYLDLTECEIIGNVFDNPELLKVTE